MTRSPYALPVLMLALAFPISGQEPDTSRADTTVALPLPPLVVSASKVPLRANEVGFHMSVLDGEALRIRRPVYAFDGLRELAGSYIDEAAGPGGPTIVRLRGGEEVFTQILLDGVQMNQNGGFFDFQGLALSNLGSIEVAKGPQSALYGSSAVSGVVQFLTPRGVPGRIRASLTVEGGEASTRGGSFRSAAQVSGGSQAFQFSSGAGLAFSRGIYALAHDTWSGDVAMRGDWVVSDRWDVGGLFRYIRYSGNLPVRDPGATRVPLDPNARNERDRIVTSLAARFQSSPQWSHELKGTLYWEDFLFLDRLDGVPQNEEFFVFDSNIDFDTSLLRPGLEYNGSYTRQAGDSRSITISYGARVEREQLDEHFTGDFGEPGTEFGGDSEFDRNSVSGFTEVVARASTAVTLVAGARLEKYEELDAELTPRASVVVEAVRDVLSLSAAWGQAYKIPDLQQQFGENPFLESNPDLEPETSESFEFGLDLTSRDGRVAVSLAYFHQDFKNLIREVGQENSDRQIRRNLGAAEAEGLEWSVRARAARTWTVGTEGAWVGTKILDNTGLSGTEFPEGEELPFRPDVIGSVFLDVSPHPRVDAHVRVTRYGEQTVLTERFTGQRRELDAYVLTSLVVNYRASRGVTFYGRLGNLFDVDYETAFDRRGMPLNGAAGVRISN